MFIGTASNRAATETDRMLALRSIKSLSFLPTGTLACLTLTILLFGLPVSAQDQGVPAVREGKTAVSDAQVTRFSSNNLQADQKTLGSVSGKVVDQAGASIGGARVQLAREDESAGQEVLTDDKGDFSFDHVAPGDFHLTIMSEGLAPQDYSATLRPGEAYETPLVMLVVATQVTQVQVRLTQEEIADEQVKEQEKQRVLGFIPNFYVTYHHDAVPLTARQKFRLAWKSSTDHVSRERYPAFASEARPALLLQRNRQQALAVLLCARQLRDLQGRQRKVAAELFKRRRQSRRRRDLQSLLSGQGS